MATTTIAKTKTAAILRRRLLQFRSAFTQCFPFFFPSSSNNGGNSRKRKMIALDDSPVKQPTDDSDSRCVLPLIDADSGTLSPVMDEEQSVASPPPSTTVAATVSLEPLRPLPHHRLISNRVNRTFLLRKSKSVLKQQLLEHSKPKKPVTSSRFGSKSPSPSSSKPSSSSARFHSAKASMSGCLMTFVIFTNGSSTRMWFLVSRQPHDTRNGSKKSDQQSAKKNEETGDEEAGSSQAQPSDHNVAERPSSSAGASSSRRRNVSTPPVQTSSDHLPSSNHNSSQHEKKRLIINRFLCSEDGKCTGADGRSRLAIAASWACPAAIKLLLRRGAPVNSVDSRGKAALHYVAYGHSSVDAVVECLLLLLDAGAQVNCFDDEYNTPLHLAALAGCGPAMGLLLRRGADSSLPNATGRTPVFNFLNNAFNADNIPALLELAAGSPYAFAGTFHLSKTTPPPTTFDHDHGHDLLPYDSSPSKRLLDTSGRMPLVLKLTLQPSLMPVHVDESLVLSSQFKELLCLFAICPPSLQLLATYSIRNAILDALHAAQKSSKTPSTDSIKAAASVIDLPNSLKCFLFTT